MANEKSYDLSTSRNMRISITRSEWKKVDFLCEKETRKTANLVSRALRLYLSCFDDETGEQKKQL